MCTPHLASHPRRADVETLLKYLPSNLPVGDILGQMEKFIKGGWPQYAEVLSKNANFLAKDPVDKGHLYYLMGRAAACASEVAGEKGDSQNQEKKRNEAEYYYTIAKNHLAYEEDTRSAKIKERIESASQFAALQKMRQTQAAGNAAEAQAQRRQIDSMQLMRSSRIHQGEREEPLILAAWNGINILNDLPETAPVVAFIADEASRDEQLKVHFSREGTSNCDTSQNDVVITFTGEPPHNVAPLMARELTRTAFHRLYANGGLPFAQGDAQGEYYCYVAMYHTLGDIRRHLQKQAGHALPEAEQLSFYERYERVARVNGNINSLKADIRALGEEIVRDFPQAVQEDSTAGKVLHALYHASEGQHAAEFAVIFPMLLASHPERADEVREMLPALYGYYNTIHKGALEEKLSELRPSSVLQAVNVTGVRHPFALDGGIFPAHPFGLPPSATVGTQIRSLGEHTNRIRLERMREGGAVTMHPEGMAPSRGVAAQITLLNSASPQGRGGR